MDNRINNQLSEGVEKQVRQLIGELNMQVIVLRSMLEIAQQQQTPHSPQPDKPIVPPQPSQPAEPVVPPSGPRPVPQSEPKPTPQQPDTNPNRAARANGSFRESAT